MLAIIFFPMSAALLLMSFKLVIGTWNSISEFGGVDEVSTLTHCPGIVITGC